MSKPSCTSFRPWVRASIAASLLVFVAGCITSSESGGGTRFHYEYWISIVIFLAGLVVVPIGFLMRKSDGRLGWGLMLVGPLAALGLAPTYLIEGTTVDDKGFEARIGFFGMHRTAIAFEDVKEIRVVEEESRGRRKRVYDVLYFDLKTGESERLALGNELNIQAGKQILKIAGERGITVVGKN